MLQQVGRHCLNLKKCDFDFRGVDVTLFRGRVWSVNSSWWRRQCHHRVCKWMKVWVLKGLEGLCGNERSGGLYLGLLVREEVKTSECLFLLYLYLITRLVFWYIWGMNDNWCPVSKWNLGVPCPGGWCYLSLKWDGFPALLRDMTNRWPLFSFINGGNKLSWVVVGRVAWDVWFKNLSVIFSQSFDNSKTMSSLPGGFL